MGDQDNDQVKTDKAKKKGEPMRVKMLQHIAGRPSYAVGDIVDLDPDIAKVWIEEGMATPLRESKNPLEHAVRS